MAKEPVKAKRHPPVLPAYHMLVRARGKATVYTNDGTLISNETWTPVPISPEIIMAIKGGDLEEGEAVEKVDTVAA
jgi:hypothetical protein